MATTRWLGHARPIAEVRDYLYAGTWEADDIVNVTINGKTVATVTGSTVIATLIDTIVTALNALSATTYPEHAEITWSRSGSNLRATADTAGRPIVCTVATTETGGGAADLQTIDGAATSTGTASTANAGPNDWNTADNWSGDAVPVAADDVYIEDSDIDILYGLAQSGVTLTSLNIAATYTGKIGLPRRNTDNTTEYEEFRQAYLLIGATTTNLGYGDGGGSARIKLDNSSIAATVNVLSTGSAETNGVEAFLWKGTHELNAVNVQKGSVGIAIYGGETAAISQLRISYRDSVQGDANVRCGAGVTFGGSGNVDKRGGTLETNSGLTTFTQLAGDAVLKAGNHTTLNLDGGRCWYNGIGTLTTVNIGSGASLDLSREIRTCTITNAVNVNAGATFLDPFKRAGSVVVDLERCGGTFRDEENTVINLGTHLRLTRGSAS